MNISLNWLKDFVNIKKGLTPEALGELLTLKTAEIEKVGHEGENLNNVVTGKLVSFKKIPNTKHHHEGTVDIGKKRITLVFGSIFKLTEGWILPIALPGATLPGPNGEMMEIREVEMHGVASQGIICTDRELGICNSETGLTVFSEGTKLGEPIAKVLGLDDVIFEVDNKSLTHRPDLWGHYGIAREIAAITDEKLKPYKADQKFPDKGENLEIEIRDPEISPRFCACLMSGLKIGKSPAWMQKRLKSAGIGAINNVVDVTNYVMLEYGQPMHAYDRDIVGTDKLVVEFAAEGQTVETIDHKKRKLTGRDAIVTNGKDFLGIAGIMGGVDSEINDNTVNIIVEAANWNPGVLRPSSVRLGLRSDASQRFEKSPDPAMCDVAVKKAAELILKMCPTAKITSPLIDVGTYKPKEKKLTLNIPKTNSKIGIKIPTANIKKILENLEFKIKEKTKDEFEVTVPGFRGTKDVTTQDDLIEEVARMSGYENIPEKLPTLPTKLPLENTERFKKHRARDLFSYGLGFDEVYNYSFYSHEDLKNCLMTEDNHLKILNYMSEDQTHLRTTLIPNLFKNIQLNVKYHDNFRLYEIGRTYKEINEFMPLEEKRLGGAVVTKGQTDEIFYEAKGAVEALLKKFNIDYPEPIQKITNAPYAHPAKALTYLEKSGATLAQVFMTHPNAVKNHELEKYSIAFFEINFSEAMKLIKPTRPYKKITKFPSIVIDISVVIDRTTEIRILHEAIRKADPELITDISLFDIYEGKPLGKGEKAVAFTVTLRAPDRTLTDKEMAKVQATIFKNLEALGGKIRGKEF